MDGNGLDRLRSDFFCISQAPGGSLSCIRAREGVSESPVTPGHLGPRGLGPTLCVSPVSSLHLEDKSTLFFFPLVVVVITMTIKCSYQ